MYGGRWNRPGTAVIYAAQTASLAALEVLVHYSVLPRNHVLTEIQVPDGLAISRLEEGQLPDGWNTEIPNPATQELGKRWIREKRSAVLSVPSCIIPRERNYVIDPAHPEFGRIIFQPSISFRFDPRLKP